MYRHVTRVLVILLLWFMTPGIQTESVAQTFPRLQEGRRVVIAVPDTFRVPAHAGETPGDLAGVSGIVVPWNPWVDMIVLAKEADSTDVTAVIGAFLRSTRTAMGSDGVLLVGTPPPSAEHRAGTLRDLMSRLRSAPIVYVVGLGPSRVLRFNSSETLLRYAAFAPRDTG